MSKLSLSMKVSMLQNGEWRWIPTYDSQGFELEYIAAKGGEVRKFVKDQEIPNDMIIGAEFTEAKFLGNLVVGRFSDGFSLDLANLSRTQESVSIGVTVFAGLRAINFLAKNVKISWFNRSIAKGKNYERVKFSFASNDAKIDYGSANEKNFNEALEKVNAAGVMGNK